jgi:hypothetical protein
MLEIRKVYLVRHCRKGIHPFWVKTTSGKWVVDVIVSGHINTMVDGNGKEISEKITERNYNG